MFFVLSGYVIGLTTSPQPAAGEVRRYAARRALRLLPISTVAVLLSWALLPSIAPRTILGNLLFLQSGEAYPGGVSFDLLPNNPNLWSLNYEAVYYVGFIVLWCWAPAPGLVWLALAVAAAGSAVFGPAVAVPSHWACGGLYWLAGLTLARRSAPAGDARRGNWPAALLGAYALWTIAPLRSVAMEAQWHALFAMTPASLHRLDFLPAAVWLLAAVTGRAPRLCSILTWGCLAWATTGLAARAVIGGLTSIDAVSALALAAAWILRGWRPDARPLAGLAPLGAVSFGLYAVATPLQFGLRSLAPQFSGSLLTFTLRLLMLLVLSLGIAWLLERRLQPWLRRKLPC